jgi:hypothetical protein
MTTPLKLSDIQEITSKALKQIEREMYATMEEVETYFAGVCVKRYQQEILNAAERGRGSCDLAFHIPKRIGRTLRLYSTTSDYETWLSSWEDEGGSHLNNLLLRIADVRIKNIKYTSEYSVSDLGTLWVHVQW